MPTRDYSFYVYILASRSRQTYVGVTNSLRTRVREHQAKPTDSYTARYNINRLVYYEHFEYILNAIARENELKGWNRTRKLELIEQSNPTWHDLSSYWPNLPAFYPEEIKKQEADSFTVLRNDNELGTDHA